MQRLKFGKCIALIAAAGLSFMLSAAQASDPVGHRLIACDKGRVAIIGADGKVEWEAPLHATAHDIQVLPNGNFLLHSGGASIEEMTPQKKIVWTYTAKPKAGYAGNVEIHAFQRLANGLTMVSENGNRRVVEVDRDGKIVHETPMTVDRPETHRDARMARKLANGNYLVCHEGDGMVREYAPSGRVVWSYKLDLDGRPETPTHQGHGTHVFGAVRLPSGNTLIACGDGNRVIEVTPTGKTVWKLDYNELPGIHLYWVTTLQVLPNGNIIIGNTHAGPDNPQLVEVTRDKKVVWTFNNQATFGNDLCAAEILDTPVLR